MLKRGDMNPIITNYLQSAAHKRSPKDFTWASSSILKEMIAHLVEVGRLLAHPIPLDVGGI
jgi:hypothetical protein